MSASEESLEPEESESSSSRIGNGFVIGAKGVGGTDVASVVIKGNGVVVRDVGRSGLGA